MQKYVNSESVFSTLHIEIKHKFSKEFPSYKINGTKMPFFFFRELQLITDLLLICDSYLS